MTRQRVLDSESLHLVRFLRVRDYFEYNFRRRDRSLLVERMTGYLDSRPLEEN